MRRLSKSICARLARVSLTLALLALALLSHIQPAAAASTTAQAKGSGIQFHAKESFAVVWLVAVSTAPIQFSGSTPIFPSGASIKTASSGGFAQTSFDPFVGGLTPNTTFNYILSAGAKSLTGSVKTLQRSMTIDFNTYTITNDSDDFGAGELSYSFRVNGVYRSDLDFFNFADNTGETFTVSRKATLTNGGASVPLAVEVQDDDCSFSSCVRPADFTSGSDADNDWATAKTSVSGVSDQSNFVSKTVTMAVNGPVGFKVTIFVQVAYF